MGKNSELFLIASKNTISGVRVPDTNPSKKIFFVRIGQAKIIRTFSLLEMGSDLSFSTLIRISTVRLTDIGINISRQRVHRSLSCFLMQPSQCPFSAVTILHTLADLLRIQRRKRYRLRMLWQEPEARGLVSLFSSMP